MVRLETLIRVGIGMARVENEHFVQQRGAGAPMADNEQGSLHDRHMIEPIGVPRFLHPAQQCMAEADEGDNEGDVPLRRRDGQMIATEQTQPGEEIAALPNVRHPFAWLRRRRIVKTARRGHVRRLGTRTQTVYFATLIQTDKMSLIIGAVFLDSLCRIIVKGRSALRNRTSCDRATLTRRGVEQWQLARLITWRSVVRIHSPQFRFRCNSKAFCKWLLVSAPFSAPFL